MNLARQPSPMETFTCPLPDSGACSGCLSGEDSRRSPNMFAPQQRDAPNSPTKVLTDEVLAADLAGLSLEERQRISTEVEGGASTEVQESNR